MAEVQKAYMSPMTVLSLFLLSVGAPGSVQAQQYVLSTVAGVLGNPLPMTPVRGVDLTIVPRGLATDATANVYFITFSYVLKLDQNGIATRVAGSFSEGSSGDGGPAISAQLRSPNGLAVDGAGNLFIADTGNDRVRKVSASGIITTVAGSGTPGFSGDGGPAPSAQLHTPIGVAVDGAGNLFIAEYANHRVRKVSPGGIITTVAGNGIRGFSGDGGPGATAQLSYPRGVAVDGAGDLFIADEDNNAVRKVSKNGTITTVTGAAPGFSGDGGPAVGAQLLRPTGVTVDPAGNLFIGDAGNHRVRKVSPAGIITTAAGDGTEGFAGDGRPATSAQLNYVRGLAVDGGGSLFIADGVNNRVRKVSTNAIITTVAGNGTDAFLPSGSGDPGPATSAH